MECKEFFLRLQHVESILAEERYVLQRQLDNHLKLNAAKTINNFSDIYNEFSEQISKLGEIKYKSSNYTQEEMKEIHKKNLEKMGLEK